jgi:hypothetical protein
VPVHINKDVTDCQGKSNTWETARVQISEKLFEMFYFTSINGMSMKEIGKWMENVYFHKRAQQNINISQPSNYLPNSMQHGLS